MRRYHLSLNRTQKNLLQPRVEDYISANNPVRAIDAYINTLNWADLEFQNTQLQSSAGRPPYEPAALLKRYLYGYMQGIRSRRKLERMYR